MIHTHTFFLGGGDIYEKMSSTVFFFAEKEKSAATMVGEWSGGVLW